MSVPPQYVILSTSEINEIEALLTIEEKFVGTVYNDGPKGNNPTIGIGANISLSNPTNLALALQQMTFFRLAAA
jgi:hypothetical protein